MKILKLTDVEHFVFPGGEVNVKLDDAYHEPVTIVAKLDSSDEIMKLLLTTDALRKYYIL